MKKILLIVLFFCLPLCSEVERLMPQIITAIPHDISAFTQGLAFDKGILYESTGLYGHSSIRKLDPRTGKILLEKLLPSRCFGEGIAVVNNQLIQLTWKEEKAFVYESTNLRLLRTIPIQGEGWGLCSDGDKVLMTTGSSEITTRDPSSFAIQDTQMISYNHEPVCYLNDLESDGQFLYVNVWKKDTILRIDKKTGQINGLIDASNLLSPIEKEIAGPQAVLNGIAYNKDKQTFYITGKMWPWIFEVKFIRF